MSGWFDSFNQATGLTEDPSKVAKDAQSAALAFEKEKYADTKANMQPFVDSAQANLGRMNTAMASGNLLDPNARYKDFKFSQDDPSYQWRVKQGTNALAAQSSAMGNLGSGNLGTALINYGQEAGSQEYQNAFNRYQSQLNDWMAQRAASYNMFAGSSNPAAPMQMGNFAMQSGVQGANTMLQGAGLQQQGMQQQANNMQGSLGALSNIGKSIYDWYNQNQQYNPYSSSSYYGSDYGNYGSISGSDIQGGYNNMEGNLTY